MTGQWQPGVSLEMLGLRARLLQQIRSFMADRNILEVDTPVLGHYAVTDPNLQSLATVFRHPGNKAAGNLYLHTSPEVPMKRLLAGGSGAIYQICHVFRDAEAGRLHNPEFTLLEWYRPGYDHHDLMQEMNELLQWLNLKPAVKKTYADVFIEAVGINPHTAELSALKRSALETGLVSGMDERSDLLDYLFSHRVHGTLGMDQPLLLYDYPACQAALSRIRTGEPPVAERFELFINGMEIANGFHELCDAGEQRARFEDDQQRRRRAGKPEHLPDENLLQALVAGLPPCAGVALGLDRLLMVITQRDNIDAVIPFTVNRA